MKKQILDIVANNLSMEREDVAAIIDEFMLQLHRRIVEYEGFNGDYLGEELRHELCIQAYFHFLGFLDRFSERYKWEPGSAYEYVATSYRPIDWRPFSHQMTGWKESKHYDRSVKDPENKEKNS